MLSSQQKSIPSLHPLTRHIQEQFLARQITDAFGQAEHFLAQSSLRQSTHTPGCAWMSA